METQQFEEGMTLDRFIFETTKAHAHAQGQFATLLQQLALAARLVSARVNRAGLAGILGAKNKLFSLTLIPANPSTILIHVPAMDVMCKPSLTSLL